MYELTREIGSIVQNSYVNGNETLTSFDAEHILKVTSDATNKIKFDIPKLTV